MTVGKYRQQESQGSWQQLSWEAWKPVSYITQWEQLYSDNPRTPGNGYFSARKWKVSGSICANGGPNPHGHGSKINFPSAMLGGRLFPNYNIPDEVPSIESCATKLQKDTNPNAPHVDIPQFLGELRELPSLLRVAGNSFIKQAYRHKNAPKSIGDAYLQVQFGWVPFFRDLITLTDFQRAVSLRVKQLRNLRDKGTMSYKRTLYKGGFAEEGAWQGYSPPVPYWQGKTVDIWGTIKWYSDTQLPTTDEGLLRLAVRSALGLNSINFSTAWELLPWSWLVDWFANVGDFLAATRNDIPMVHSPMLIMRRVVAQFQHPSFSEWPGAEYSPGVFTMDTKERFPVASASIEAKLPFLTDKQFSILAALGVTRRSGGVHL